VKIPTKLGASTFDEIRGNKINSTMTETRNTYLDAGKNSHPTLLSTILDIARLHTPNNKSKSWFKHLSCLWINAASPNTLQIVKGTPYGNNDADYIAVSYSWTPTPRLECDRNGKYVVTGARGDPVRKSVVRDEVLERVLRYANHIGKSRVWIDKECSPQENLVEKQTAMNSMDLVYRQSRHPVGLLAVVFDDQSEVNYLQTLMMGGSVVRRNEDGYPKLFNSVTSSTSLGIFNVLVHLYKDRWWTRAWIFQEEYLSSTAMQILIRRKQGIRARQMYSFVHGEICLNAVDFRKQVTLFLLAFKRESQCGRAKKCSRMLERFGRYELQYHFQHDARRKAMSPRIFADIQRRGLESPFDRLPIVANSCNYAIRLVSRDMLKSGHSVELCLLTMYLLNGEIMRNGRHIKKLPTEMGISNYMQYISFNKFDPPVKQKRLSYLKAYRLHDVSLHPEGLLTKGFLWHVTGTLRPSKWAPCRRNSRKNHDFGLNDFQRDRIFQLADVLRKSRCWMLAAEMEKYLVDDMTRKKPTTAKRHMDIMAESVVEAIRTGVPLQTTETRSSGNSCGVFVGVQDSSMGMFTSWHAGIDADGRWRESHVSLGVEVLDMETPPLLATVTWVNGLVFFKQSEQEAMLFKWPSVWTEENQQQHTSGKL
jgi:hypothetical protein